MPGLTKHGLPYPLPTEPVAEGAAAIRALAEATDEPEAWRAPVPPLTGPWFNVGYPAADAGYYRDRSGVVRIRGLVGGGTNNSVIFVLPVGYRPASDQRFASIAYDGTTERLARIDIAVSGNVSVNVVSASTIANVTLSCSFRVAPGSLAKPAPEQL